MWTEASSSYRACMVLAHPDSAYGSQVARYMHRFGWQVHLARTGREARQLVRDLAPDAIVLDVDLLPESGWLTCAKLQAEQPEALVLLLSDGPQPDGPRYAAFVGAAGLVRRDDGLENLAHEVFEAALPACPV